MGFGSLFRSNSDPKQRSSRRQHTSRQRPQSTYVRHTNTEDAAAAYHKAAAIYEAEEAQIMKDELRKRNRNDQECRRHMDMIERKMCSERQDMDEALAHAYHVSKANYRAGKIGSRELERSQRKAKQQTDAEWTTLVKWQKTEQAKAQRIFFARGEEIGASTGAALRRAREKKERNQRITIH